MFQKEVLESMGVLPLGAAYGTIVLSDWSDSGHRERSESRGAQFDPSDWSIHLPAGQRDSSDARAW